MALILLKILIQESLNTFRKQLVYGILFFTDQDLFATQIQTLGFGPLPPDNPRAFDEYRVASLHTLPALSTAKAYALCKGQIFAQEVNSTTVNLILKPSEQPGEGLSDVEFIIYKGIDRSSIFNGNEVLTSSTIRLVEKINAAQLARLLSGAAPAAALGLNLDSSEYADADRIEKLFYHNINNPSSDAFEPPGIDPGDSLGIFNPAQFGIEIICKRLGYSAPLAAARSVDHLIRVPYLPTSPQPTQAEAFLHWHQKEELLSYVDPAAFFGGMFTKGISCRVSTSPPPAPLEPPPSTPYNGNPLYDNVIQFFANKNIIYLDIRNERNHSFDYYNNYGRNIEIGYGASSQLTSKNYYSDGWPLQRLNFGTGNIFPTTDVGIKSILKLSMPLIAENPLPLLYVHYGFPEKKPASSTFPKPPQQVANFIDVTPDPNTPTIPGVAVFALRNRDGLSVNTLFSAHIKLSHVQQRDPMARAVPPATNSLAFGAMHFADNLFPIFEMTVPFNHVPNTTEVRIKNYPEEIYIDDPINTDEEYTVSIGTGIDPDNITFYATASVFKASVGSAMRKALVVVSNRIKGMDDFLQYVSLLTGNHSLQKRKILRAEAPLELEYIVYEAQNLFPTTSTEHVSLDDFISITLTNAEFEELEDARSNAGFEHGYRVYMGLDKIADESGQDTLLQAYRSYEIVLRGYKLQTNTLIIHNVSTGIKVVTYGSK